MSDEQYRNLYAERDLESLDEAGDYYSRHIHAMTKEGLCSKSDIAAELAWRDRAIDELIERVIELGGGKQ